jgi:hypothetical protein
LKQGYSCLKLHHLIHQGAAIIQPRLLSGDFTVPAGSSYEEKKLYLQFIQRLEKARELDPGAGKKIQEALREAMTKQGSS